MGARVEVSFDCGAYLLEQIIVSVLRLGTGHNCDAAPSAEHPLLGLLRLDARSLHSISVLRQNFLRDG
ncbi:unnamed protein product [Mycena citricolor]|uniref:Uncharacterized protein n=1 Tax=Mycena citricolor TaxID=2018698 RepID=A0AAD2GUF8_9AGAR|nr:unnamed protein product [Mycena citricolor]